MVRVRVGCQFDFDSDGTVPTVILVQPRPDGAHRVVREVRMIAPDVPVREYHDLFGNVCWRLVMPAGPTTVRYDALVDVSGEPDPVPAALPLALAQDLPDDTLIYTLPSRYAESDLLADQAWSLFGSTPPTGERVLAICDWVHNNIRYATGTSDPTVTALTTFQRGYGVCRDLALLTVAFCRALNIPARYAFGYLPDIGVVPPDSPMDFHAWFNAFIAGEWYTFDARHNVPRIGRVQIAHGRDAVDVAMATTFGTSRLNRFEVWSDEVPADTTELLLPMQRQDRLAS
jgi:transglutaminase-like putative cysteine protease